MKTPGSGRPSAGPPSPGNIPSVPGSAMQQGATNNGSSGSRNGPPMQMPPQPMPPHHQHHHHHHPHNYPGHLHHFQHIPPSHHMHLQHPQQHGGGGPGDENPFADFMWMENEEDYNRQVEQELWEEEFLERCFQEMLDEEESEWFIPSRDLPRQAAAEAAAQLNGLSLGDGPASSAAPAQPVSSSLNPNAKEFVPGMKY